jgi:hypothetical protein
MILAVTQLIFSQLNYLISKKQIWVIEFKQNQKSFTYHLVSLLGLKREQQFKIVYDQFLKD